MSPAAGLLLVDEVVPIIQATVPRSVKRVGAEDFGELVQDTIVMAAQMIESCEARGKPIYPGSVAFYAIQHAKTGRRSYGATRTDALCAAVQLDENVTIASMDEPVAGEHEDEMTLHDMLAGPVEDVAQQAARELDWAALMENLSERDLAILRTTINGERLHVLAQQFGVSQPRLTQLKREIGRQIQLRWGPTVLEDIARHPAWCAAIHAKHERQACRYERAREALAS
jgi:hypothetical protein